MNQSNKNLENTVLSGHNLSSLKNRSKSLLLNAVAVASLSFSPAIYAKGRMASAPTSTASTNVDGGMCQMDDNGNPLSPSLIYNGICKNVPKGKFIFNNYLKEGSCERGDLRKKRKFKHFKNKKRATWAGYKSSFCIPVVSTTCSGYKAGILCHVDGKKQKNKTTIQYVDNTNPQLKNLVKQLADMNNKLNKLDQNSGEYDSLSKQLKDIEKQLNKKAGDINVTVTGYGKNKQPVTPPQVPTIEKVPSKTLYKLFVRDNDVRCETYKEKVSLSDGSNVYKINCSDGFEGSVITNLKNPRSIDQLIENELNTQEKLPGLVGPETQSNKTYSQPREVAGTESDISNGRSGDNRTFSEPENLDNSSSSQSNVALNVPKEVTGTVSHDTKSTTDKNSDKSDIKQIVVYIKKSKPQKALSLGLSSGVGLSSKLDSKFYKVIPVMGELEWDLTRTAGSESLLGLYVGARAGYEFNDNNNKRISSNGPSSEEKLLPDNTTYAKTTEEIVSTQIDSNHQGIVGAKLGGVAYLTNWMRFKLGLNLDAVISEEETTKNYQETISLNRNDQTMSSTKGLSKETLSKDLTVGFRPGVEAGIYLGDDLIGRVIPGAKGNSSLELYLGAEGNHNFRTNQYDAKIKAGVGVRF